MKVVADFHIGDKASVWKPTPTKPPHCIISASGFSMASAQSW